MLAHGGTRVTSTPRSQHDGIAYSGALLLCAGLLAAPWRGHIDDIDAQLYLVVARNLARDHAWLNLRFLPRYLPQFREHLPFGFWPAAAAIRLIGEWSVAPLYALFTLGAIVASARIARGIGGDRAALAAIILLGTCESIWQYGGRLLLDPPLMFFATAAAAAALTDSWIAAALLGSLAVLIKGPFGLLSLVCVALARRRIPGAVAVLAACIPLAVFLLIDPGSSWRSGYLHPQLLASATGARSDGRTEWWFLLYVVVGRFWPGLPFAVLGLWQARREARFRPLAIACLLMAVFLCLPPRKWGNHAYVAFPLLAALAGAAAGPFLERIRPQLIAATIVAAAALAWALSLAGAGRLVLRSPCAFSTVLREPLDNLHAGEPLLEVSSDLDVLSLAELAAERDLLPWPETRLPVSSAVHDAVARQGTTVPASWVVVAEGGGWSVLRAR
jgi:4-amino-4-deoxy-L-arabinose transferase-like glycosyltransferase